MTNNKPIKTDKDLLKNINYLALAPDRYLMTSYDAALALHQIAARYASRKKLAFLALEAADEVLRATPVYEHELINASEEI